MKTYIVRQNDGMFRECKSGDSKANLNDAWFWARSAVFYGRSVVIVEVESWDEGKSETIIATVYPGEGE